MNQQNNKNVLLATALSALILISWHFFYEAPRLEKVKIAEQNLQKNHKNSQNNLQSASLKEVDKNSYQKVSNELSAKKSQILLLKSRKGILENSQNNRIKIESKNLHGSINLQGARFDDLTLAKYFEEPMTKKNKDTNKEVVLFSPANSTKRYFADFGFLSSNENIELPNPNTIWKASSKKLTPENPVQLSFVNKQNVKFIVTISLDEKYMFNIDKTIENKSQNNISIASYGRINRVLNDQKKSNYILHEGLIGVFNDVLKEVSYSDIAEDKKIELESIKNGWIGITDKYWLSSIIPDKNISYDTKFSYENDNKNNLYGSEFVGQEYEVKSGEKIKFNHLLFAGAKKINLLDQYSEKYDIKLFDRAVDFGWFYFLTRPFLAIINFLYQFLGNFGLAILVMTVFIKGALFPMASKSYAAMAKMKTLQPEIEKLRKRYADDKVSLNREMMGLYKTKKINPVSGCLPLLVQIPVFFALYKVLYVTIDMRHSPFYGWIHDLSAPDPTSIFNLFGLLPFEVSGAFQIGIWPILMGITMVLQQKLSPTTADPIQKKVLKWMPYVLTFVLAAFPAGLVIYWTWSNSLSILQQWYITKKHSK